MIAAITREISNAINECELTHLERVPIEVERARRQHADYEWALVEAGCTVRRLHAGPDVPDSVFVEDIAVVLDDLAIVARPGAASRRGETPAVVAALERFQSLYYRPFITIEEPGTLDGGDVLALGRDLYVGLSGRTNGAAVDQLRATLGPVGYSIHAIPVRGCLHLKSAVTAVTADTLLINRGWVPPAAFEGVHLIDVHPDEPYGANAAVVGDRLLYPGAFPRTRERLDRLGLDVRTVDVSELAKAEGAVTCCSLIFNA